MVASATVTPDQRALVIHTGLNGRPGAILDSREPGFIPGSRPSPLSKIPFRKRGCETNPGNRWASKTCDTHAWRGFGSVQFRVRGAERSG